MNFRSEGFGLLISINGVCLFLIGKLILGVEGVGGGVIGNLMMVMLLSFFVLKLLNDCRYKIFCKRK